MKLRERLRRYWIEPLDPAPLGLVRVTFGLVLVIATLDVAPVLVDLLSDAGAMPRGALLASAARPNRFSVYDIAGPIWVTWLLWLMTVAACLSFCVGWHTRAANFASLLLVSGLHERNQLVFDGSDVVIRVMLFWFLFLPTGARYSIDALRRRARGLPPAPGPSAWFVRLAQIQFAWIYFDSVLYKLGGTVWPSGHALHYALGLEHLFSRKIGVALSNARWFVVPGTYVALAIETAFIFMMFAPLWQPRLKAVGLALGALLHLSIAVTMNVGNFCWLMISMYPLFFEPRWADGAVGLVRRPARALREHLDRIAEVRNAIEPIRDLALAHAHVARSDGGRADPLPPPSAARSAPSAWTRAGTGLFRAAGAVTLVSALWLSLPKTPFHAKVPSLVQKARATELSVQVPALPGWLFNALQFAELWQSWDMFAPNPASVDLWLKGIGNLVDGTAVDPLRDDRGGPLPAPGVGLVFTRWTKYTHNLAYTDNTNLLEFGKFICRRWNTSPPSGRAQLKLFKIYRVQKELGDLGEAPKGWEEKLIWDHRCF
jgi:hypothetical protein